MRIDVADVVKTLTKGSDRILIVEMQQGRS